MTIRTRFAPSPTGDLHIGSARTALFNYLYARSHGGQFILRIEDTDRERSRKESTKQLLEAINWLGMEWDEGPEYLGANSKEKNFLEQDISYRDRGPVGPYFQSQRNDCYKKYIDILLKQGNIYPCFCNKVELEKEKTKAKNENRPTIYGGKCRHLNIEIAKEKLKRESFVFRFKVPQYPISFTDGIKGSVKQDFSLVGDFVIQREDGTPTYNFAVVIDDALMKITDVIRGDDHLSNTPRQLLIYQALNFKEPRFFHLSMIWGEDKQKLSKRHGANSVLEYKKMGYLPEAFNNFLALLGWTPVDQKEVIPWKDLKQSLTRAKFSKSPAIFNIEKLSYLNSQFIQNLDNDLFLQKLSAFVKNTDYYQSLSYSPYCQDILTCVKPYLKTLSDINHYLPIFFEPDLSCSREIADNIKEKISTDFVQLLINQLSNQTIKNEELFSIIMTEAKEKLGIKGKDFFHSLRLLITFSKQGIDLKSILSFTDANILLKRVKKCF